MQHTVRGQIHISPQKTRHRNKPREPLEEGAVEGPAKKTRPPRYTQGELHYIKLRSAELIREGKNNTEMSRILAREMGRHPETIKEKISILMPEENPNRHEAKRFNAKELSLLKTRRAELIREGKKDAEISRILAKEMDRSAASIAGKIRSLVESKKLEENPNRNAARKKPKRFTSEEVALLKTRRAELILEAKKDRGISRIMAGELEGWSFDSILQKICGLIKSGELAENPNKQGGVLSPDAQKAAIQEVLYELERFGGRS